MTRQTFIGGTTIYAGSTGTIAVTSAVPEPATWATMLIGFGGIGFAVRRRRRSQTGLATA